MTVAYHRVCPILCTVLMHEVLLLLLRVRREETGGAVAVVFRCEPWVAVNLRAVERLAAEVGTIAVAWDFLPCNVHFTEKTAHGVMRRRVLTHTPAVLQRDVQSVIIL